MMKFLIPGFYFVAFMAFGAVPSDFKEPLSSLKPFHTFKGGVPQASLDINQTEVLMVKSQEGTCAIPLTREFVSNSGVDADEFMAFLRMDQHYSHFQQKRT